MRKSIYNPEPLRVIYREVIPISTSPSSPIVLKETSRWERGPLLHLTPEADWTTTVTLSDLWPSTEYEWTVAFTHNHTRPNHERVQRFMTFPDPRLSKARSLRASELLGSTLPRSKEEDSNPLDDPNHFTFAVSSCVKPDFPWHPMQFGLWSWIAEFFRPDLARRNQIKGFDLMADRTIDSRVRSTPGSFNGHPSIRFFLQLGDLIYADVPLWQGWLGDGPKVEHYRKLYRNLFASTSFRRLYEHVPVIGIYDDHEAKNNWSGGSKDAMIQAAIPPATQAWQEYIGLANPTNTVLEGKGEHWYTFRHGDSAFFVLDVRKHRADPEMADSEEKQVLGEVQKEALYSWLSAVNTSSTTFKFIVSSVPFNSMWGGPIDMDGQKDSWAGYLTERDELLDTLHYVPNVIVLSGDRHEFAAAALARKKTEEEEASEGYTRWPVTEFSTSPLNMFCELQLSFSVGAESRSANAITQFVDLPIRTLSQEHGRGATGQEKLLKYLPDGNVKWTEIEVDTRDALRPLLRATVVIDGEEAWKLDIVGQPVVSAPAQAVGGLAKTLLEWLGFGSKTWF
jgi:alkaline phosphatase D